MFKIGTIVLCAGFLLVACRKTTPVVTTPVPADIPEFRQGLAALHEFTPDGYARAVEYFQRASELAPEKCEYRLEAAQASLLLALEQRLNSEDFRSAWERGADPQCAPETSFAIRLDAFRSLDDFGSRDRTILQKINQAIQLQPADAFNWIIRWKINPTATRQENAILLLITVEQGTDMSH